MSETHDRTADEIEQDLNYQLGNTGNVIREFTERQVVPSGHAPRLETVVGRDWDGICVSEARQSMDAGTWIMAENPVEVVR